MAGNHFPPDCHKTEILAEPFQKAQGETARNKITRFDIRRLKSAGLLEGLREGPKEMTREDLILDLSTGLAVQEIQAEKKGSLND